MRVFVTVGNAPHPFDRLMRMVDEALPREGVSGVCQHGSSSVVPRGLEGRERLSRAEFERELRESDVVICQAGVGSIRAALDAGHRPIVLARSAAHGEIVNSHQEEIARELERAGRITWVRDAEALARALAPGTTRQTAADDVSVGAELDALASALREPVTRTSRAWHSRMLHALARRCDVRSLRYSLPSRRP